MSTKINLPLYVPIGLIVDLETTEPNYAQIFFETEGSVICIGLTTPIYKSL